MTYVFVMIMLFANSFSFLILVFFTKYYISTEAFRLFKADGNYNLQANILKYLQTLSIPLTTLLIYQNTSITTYPFL